MIGLPRRPSGPFPSSTGRRAAPLAAALLLAIGGACAPRADDPAVRLLARSLKRGDRALLLRSLDQDGTRLVAVVDTLSGKPELRLYERREAGDYTVAHTVQQGDSFRNLDLADVDGDGKDELVVTWEGGHLEVVQVIAQAQDNTYKTIFENAGRQIEKRYDAAGRIEFWITSRTYDEGPGEAPAYATSVYRFQDGKYVESPRR